MLCYFPLKLLPFYLIKIVLNYLHDSVSINWVCKMTKVKVSVERIDGYCNMPMLVGDYFYVEGSKLTIPDGKHGCMWALQSMMPIFPIFQEKERLDDTHWVKEVTRFSCPDPKGLVQYRLELVDHE